MARLGFELAYYKIAVQYISHYATGTLPSSDTNLTQQVKSRISDQNKTF